MSRNEAFNEGRLINMVGRKPDAVIFDMDGTLTNVKQIRDEFLTGGKRDFHQFHERSVDMPPNHDVVEMARQHASEGKKIVVVTARKRKYGPHTSYWLADNDVPSDAMFMREDHDDRPDYEVKKDILRDVRRRFNVVHAVDDNPNVLKLWHEEGIPTTRVPGWEDEDEQKA